MRREPSGLPSRPTPMRRILGTPTARFLLGAACLVVLVGCGSSSSVATDPASDPAGNPSRAPGPVAGATVLPLISLTAAGGHPASVATTLGSASDIDRFVAQFRMPAMRIQVRQAATRAMDHGRQVVAQVVAVGCDRPPGVDVVGGDGGRVALVPHEVASPLQECLAPVTTVALATLPLG